MLEKLDISKISAQLPEVLRKILSGQVPSPAEFVDQHLASLTVLQAVILLVVGVILVVYGWQAFRLLVIANGAFFGGLGGAYLANAYVGKHMALFGLLAGGLLLAVLAIPLMRHMVAAAGGFVGSYAGYHAWGRIMLAIERPEWASYNWVGAVIGLAVLGALCFRAFRAIVMVVTSVEGGLLAVSGALALCLHHAPIADRVRAGLLGNRFFLPLLFTIPTVIGFARQYNAAKGSMSSGGKSGGSSGKRAGAAA